MAEQPARTADTALAIPWSSEPDEARRCPVCGKRFPTRVETCPDDGTRLESTGITDALVGSVLAGTYRVTKMMASGGMGRVYEALHTRLDRRVVVKVLHESQAFSKVAVERAEREARATSRIRSEHVVDVLDFIRAPDGRPGIVVPFLEGDDLSTRLERVGRLPIADAVALAIDVCAGLSAAHAVGVVHRDLKPSNIFLARSGDGREIPTILDFGVAKLGEEQKNLTQTGALVGTPAYMAPEQALGAADVDKRADIYAVGAVLYHMLTGQPPYGTEDPTATLMALLQGEPPRARSIEGKIPEGLEAILERAMAREPEKRPATAEELARMLSPFAAAAAMRDPTGKRPITHGRLAINEPTVDELTRRARWTRPLAFVRLLIGSLLMGGWVAAFGATLLFQVRPAAELGELERAALRGVPLAVAAFLVVWAIRAIVRRWRSSPEVEALSRAVKSATVSGLVTYAFLEVALRTFWAVTMHDQTKVHSLESSVALACAGLVGIAVFGKIRTSS